MTLYLLARQLPPHRSDPLVFGHRDPSRWPGGGGFPQECAKHQVTWRGFCECWLCVQDNNQGDGKR